MRDDLHIGTEPLPDRVGHGGCNGAHHHCGEDDDGDADHQCEGGDGSDGGFSCGARRTHLPHRGGSGAGHLPHRTHGQWEQPQGDQAGRRRHQQRCSREQRIDRSDVARRDEPPPLQKNERDHRGARDRHLENPAKRPGRPHRDILSGLAEVARRHEHRGEDHWCDRESDRGEPAIEADAFGNQQRRRSDRDGGSGERDDHGLEHHEAADLTGSGSPRRQQGERRVTSAHQRLQAQGVRRDQHPEEPGCGERDQGRRRRDRLSRALQ